MIKSVGIPTFDTGSTSDDSLPPEILDDVPLTESLPAGSDAYVTGVSADRNNNDELIETEAGEGVSYTIQVSRFNRETAIDAGYVLRVQADPTRTAPVALSNSVTEPRSVHRLPATASPIRAA